MNSGERRFDSPLLSGSDPSKIVLYIASSITSGNWYKKYLYQFKLSQENCLIFSTADELRHDIFSHDTIHVFLALILLQLLNFGVFIPLGILEKSALLP